MKKLRIPCFDDGGELKKIVLRMKLSSCLLLLTFMQVSAHVRSQDRLTMTVRNIGWQSFFDLLEKKSNYTFLYKDNALPRNEKIDVEARALTVPEILDNVLRRSALSYQVLSNHLVVITAKGAVVTTAADNDIRVTGRVVTSTGDPLAGATVRVKGSTQATTTDSAGVFSFTVPDDATLVVSYVGYQTQEASLSGRNRIDVSLTALPGSAAYSDPCTEAQRAPSRESDDSCWKADTPSPIVIVPTRNMARTG